MNTIPIVTVDNLSTDNFKADRKGIDIKLSQASGNGLKYTENGLAYEGGANGSGTPRVLLGVFSAGGQKTLNFNNELTIKLYVERLGSDGDYLYYSLSSQHQLRLSHYNHQDAHTYNMEGGEVEYGQTFQDYTWNSQQQQQTITYQVDGVTRTLMLSYVKLGGAFFVWCDILSTAKVGFVDGESSIGIQFGGKNYEEFYLTATYGLNHILVEGYNSDSDSYDIYLTKIDQDGKLAEPTLSFLSADNVVYPESKYNYSTKLLAVLHNNGGTLTVIDNDGDTTVFETGKTTDVSCIEIYPDPDSDDVFIAVAFASGDVVDIYHYAVATRAITKHGWFGVNFTTFKGSNSLYIATVKPISSERMGLVIATTAPGEQPVSKAIVVDTLLGNIVAEQVLTNVNVFSGVENQNWIIDGDIQNLSINVYSLGVDSISTILQHPITKSQFGTVAKMPDMESTDPANKFPGVLFCQYNQADGVVLTPYMKDGVATLDVKNVLLSKAISKLENNIGVGEIQLSVNPFMTYVNGFLQASTNDITIVN